MTANLQRTKPSRNRVARVLSSMWRQRSRTIQCPMSPDLIGKSALVTGGQAGVGEFITQGLIARGANVTSLSRGVSVGSEGQLRAEILTADLAEPTSILAALDTIPKHTFDLVICNAGINSDRYSENSMGLERTFAVNVLGHHIVYRTLMRRNQLAQEARIIMTTGDIYCIAKDCTPDFRFRAGPMAYARSKLGNLWQMTGLNRCFKDIDAFAVHPGVIASGFAGSKTGLVGAVKDRLFVSEDAGAQTALMAATQDIPRGSYLHNVLGQMHLSSDDIAMDTQKSAVLWEVLEEISKPFLNGSTA